MSENQPRDADNLPPFSRADGVLVGLIVVGTFLTLWHPFYLTPPRFERTPLLYLIIWLAWVPIALLWRPAPTRWGWRIRSVVFVLTICIALAGFGQMPVPGVFATISCADPQAIGGGQVRYVCTRQAIEERTIFTLEGPEGWPIARLVDYEFIP